MTGVIISQRPLSRGERTPWGRASYQLLSCPLASYKVAYGLPDLRSKSKSSVQYLPESTGFKRKPCTTQIPAKGHLRLK